MLPKHLNSYIWHFLKPFRGVVVLYASLALMAGLWGPFNSLLLKSIVNGSATSTPGDVHFMIWPAVLLVVNFLVFDNVTWRSIGVIQAIYQPILKNNITRESYEMIVGAPFYYFQDNLSGRVANNITVLADNLTALFRRIFPNFFRGSLMLLAALITLLTVNVRFFMTMAIWFIVFFIISAYRSKRLIALSDVNAERDASIAGQLVDSISNMSNIRLFAQQQYELTRMEKYLQRSKVAFRNKQISLVVLHTIQGGLIVVMMLFMTIFLIQLYAKQAVSVGDFVLVLGLSMEVGHMAWFTMGEVDEFNLAIGKCKQSLNALYQEQSVGDRPNSPAINISRGKIEFRDVCFSYRGDLTIFDKKNIVIQPGEKIGLVGFSGSGKSTFVNVLLRLYELNSGEILIDGQNITTVSRFSLRQSISVIPQDTTLFHRSLMDNIRYGVPEASDEEVIEASKQAHAHEFIEKLPQGYHALVGERGVKLSGGQRQRIAIARAILKAAPILILDEATSALDSVTEKYIQDSFDSLMSGRTTIVIAHRLSTLSAMDRILVFDQGKIVEEGTHQSLLDQQGHYQKMWDMQAGGFLPMDEVA